MHFFAKICVKTILTFIPSDVDLWLSQLKTALPITLHVDKLLSKLEHYMVFRFYRASRMHSADYAMARWPIDRPSVCPSVTRRYSVETVTPVIKHFHRRVATSSQCFCTKRYGNIPTAAPITGASNAMGYEKIDQYLALSRKWYKTESKLLWKANKKPYPSFRMVPFPVILSEPYPRFQGHDIIQRHITRKWYKIVTVQWQSNGKSIWSIERHHFQRPWTTPIIW